MGEWVEVGCIVADAIRQSERTVPLSSLTDMDGSYGEPVIYTLWGFIPDRPVMREWRYPSQYGFGNPDAKPCKHEVVAP